MTTIRFPLSDSTITMSLYSFINFFRCYLGMFAELGHWVLQMGDMVLNGSRYSACVVITNGLVIRYVENRFNVGNKVEEDSWCGDVRWNGKLGT